MTPAARVSAAIEVLDLVFGGQPAEQALTRWARGARYAGSKDRAAVRDHVFQALRCRRSYAVFGGGEDGRAVMIGGLRVQGVDTASLFTGEGHAPQPLTPAEHAPVGASLSEAEVANLSDWLWQVFKEDLGEVAMEQATAQHHRAPIALRVNINMKSAAQAIELLSDEGIEAHSIEACSTALIVTQGARKVRQSQAYLSGAVELQDVSSQAAMARIPLAPGTQVLDYCAGGGGKTLALAAMAPQGDPSVRFFAHDADPGRMADLPPRAARAGAQVTLLEPHEIARHAPFDVVLCDVPCTGSGTWRRAPDAKWRMTPEKIGNLMQIQKDILRSASAIVMQGGRLIYTTCSVLTRENAAQVEAFQADHGTGFVLEDQVQMPVSETGDGFFYASLIRAG